MDFPSFWRGLSADLKRRFAEALDCNIVYLFQVAGGKRRPSTKLARKIHALSLTPPFLRADGQGVSLNKLRPDVWDAVNPVSSYPPVVMSAAVGDDLPTGVADMRQESQSVTESQHIDKQKAAPDRRRRGLRLW